MELSLEPPRSNHAIRTVDEAAVVVGQRRLERSFLVTPEQLLENLPEHHIQDVDQSTVERLLALQPRPDVILLGSGPRQAFAPARVRAELLGHGIGLECMDNAACARTFNLLVSEGRRVAAAFLIP